MKTKSFLVLAALLVTTISSLEARTLIVSDVDDTIKMTDVLGNKPTIVFNGLVREKAFAGMSELYRGLSTPETDIYYVSGSPKYIRSRVRNFLTDNNFPQRENLILKDKISDSTFKYKTDSITKLIQELHPDKVILIGDDTEHDPEIFEGIKTEYPHLVENIYIRAVSNRAIPAGIISFFSAFEVGANEHLMNNLEAEDLPKVARNFIIQSNDSGIAIKERYCPREGRLEVDELKKKFASETLQTLFENIQTKIKESCN